MKGSGQYKKLFLIALFMGAQGFFVPFSSAQEIIANPNISSKTLNIQLARAIFAGKVRNWPDGQPVRLFMFKHSDPKHIKFCKERIDVFPRQLKRAWDRITYTGMSEGPTFVNSEEEMINLVTRTPGAIGYVIQLNGAESYVIPVE